MKFGKLDAQGKVIDHWQLLHESDFEDTDTKLLLHLDNDVTDYATGKTVTNTNVTFSSTVWKFNTHSGVFNGSSAYLSLADLADWYFGSGNFTLDFWVRFTNLPTSGNFMQILSQWSINPSADRGWNAYLQNTAGSYYLIFQWSTTGSDAPYLTSSVLTVSTGVWYHFAVVRNGSNVYLYHDGVSVGSGAIGTLYDSGTSLIIGAYKDTGGSATAFLDGYLDEIRVVKGTAKWTSNFTPPTAPYLGRTTTYPITRDRNTVLMISGEGVDGSTSIIDETGKTVTANGNAQIDTAQYKFGQSSILFDGTGDYLSLADSADWYMGSNDWTIDFWFRANSFSSASFICGQANTASPGTNFFEIHVSYDQLYFQTWVSSSRVGRVTSTVLSLTVNTWNHFAIVKTSGTYKAFVNGTDMTQPANTLTGVSGDYDGLFTVGSAYDSDGNRYYTNGWIDDFRVSKGLARWTSAFTPPLKTTALINGDTDEEYRLVNQFRNGYSGSTTFRLRFNGDTGSNYGYQYIAGQSSAISAARAADSFIQLSAASAVDYIGMSDSTIYAKSGYVRTDIDNGMQSVNGTTVDLIAWWGHSWNNTAPIAQMQILADQTNGLGTGTKFLLYRKVKP